MKKILMVSIAISVLLSLAGPANATLILGDEVILSHRWPGVDSVCQEKVIPVGGRATFIFHDGGFRFNVDVESERISVDFPDVGLFSGSEFTGLVVEGIVTNIIPEITTDFAGWDSSRITTGANTLAFNWSGFHTGGNGGGTYFNVESPPADVPAAHAPEPATILLLGSGLVGLAGFGRKKFRG